MAAESGQAADALKDAEKRLADMAVLIKNVSTYQKTKPVYDAYRKASGIASQIVYQKVRHCYSERVPHGWCPFCTSLRYLGTIM